MKLFLILAVVLIQLVDIEAATAISSGYNISSDSSQATNSTLTALGTNTVTGTGRIILESAAGGPRIYSAKAAGCALDTSLISGGGTDDTAKLQSLLDQATNSPITLLMDGPALTTGLNVRSNTTIWCLEGAGFFLKTNSNRSIIRNFNRTRGTATDQNIKILGGFYNGNREQQNGLGSGSNQEADGTYIVGMQFAGITGLTIEGVTVYHQMVYGIWVNNCLRVNISKCVVDVGTPPGTVYNGTDGVHINGPAQYVAINDVKITSYDDAVALNANDSIHSDMTVTNNMGPYCGQGDITDVVVNDVQLMSALTGVRLLSMDKRLDRVTVQNVTGSVNNYACVADHFVGSPNGNFGSIHLDNWNVGMLAQSATPNGPALVKFNGIFEDVLLSHFQSTPIDSRPLIWVQSDSIIRSFTVDGFHILDTNSISIPVEADGVVTNFNVNLDWQNPMPWVNPIFYGLSNAFRHVRWYGPAVPFTNTYSTIGYWNLEEASGTRADCSGYLNTLSPTNTPGGAVGKVGNCASFVSASTQYLASVDQYTCPLNLTNSMSVWAWVNLTNNGAPQAVCGHYDSTAGGGAKGWWFGTSEGGGPIFQISTSSSNYRYWTGNTSVTNAAWHFIAATYDGSGTTNGIHIYADNVAQTQAAGGSVGTMTTIDNVSNFCIGIRGKGPSCLPANGLIDEVGVANRVLTTNELSAIYNGGSGVALSCR